jgi:hypothetical protein
MEEIEIIGQGFERLCNNRVFRNAVGAIDGCHVRIAKAPREHAADYFNYKFFYSSQFQALCDHRGIFIDVFIGYPGGVHDSRILRNSPLFTQRLYPPAGKFILGDGGYPCLSQPIALITPYKAPVGEVKQRYNHHLSKGRTIVERAFGRLKQRWRSIFQTALAVKVENAPKVIAACLALHNFFAKEGDMWDDGILEQDANEYVPQEHIGEEVSGLPWRNRLADQVSAVLADPEAVLNDHDYF